MSNNMTDPRIPHMANRIATTVVHTIVLLAFILGFVPPAKPVFASEATVDGTASAIQAGINTVASGASLANPGIVNVRAGTWTIGGSVTVPSYVTLAGAGIGVTVLNTIGTSQVINVSGTRPRVTGLSLVNPGNSGGYGIDVNNAVDFRVDNCRIEGYGPGYLASIRVRGLNAKGVIDHCYIKGPLNTTAYGVAVFKDGWWPNEAIGDRDTFFGANFATYQADAVYIEDNTIVNTRHAVASNNGAYYVFRHNTVNGGNNNTSSRVDAHGVTVGQNGTRFYEVYDNTINTPAPESGSFAINPRGGDGLIYNNKVTGYNVAVTLTLEENQSNAQWQPHQIHRTYVWGNTGAPIEVNVGTWVPSNKAIVEGTDWFHYARPGYTPYTYPHPLTSGGKAAPDAAPVKPDGRGSEAGGVAPPGDGLVAVDRGARADGAAPAADPSRARGGGCGCNSTESGSSDLAAAWSGAVLLFLLLLRGRIAGPPEQGSLRVVKRCRSALPQLAQERVPPAQLGLDRPRSRQGRDLTVE